MGWKKRMNAALPLGKLHNRYSRCVKKRRIKQTPPKVKPKLKSLTSNQVRKKIAKGELR